MATISGPPKVLITGANGFIGSHLTADLLSIGYDVVAAVRDPEKMRRRFPRARCVHADFNRMTTIAHWQSLLEGVDYVLNCAGILQSRRGQSAAAIHAAAPTALFKAAAESGVKRIVQISAVSVGADTEYATTKRAGDEALAALDTEWVILRPSLVYAHTAYGGTAMLRALAATPFAIPVIGGGEQTFQPIHIADVTRSVRWALTSAEAPGKIVEACGPQTVTMRELLQSYRRWLGLARAPVIAIPRLLVGLACRLGDVLGSGPMTTTSLRQLEYGNAADPAKFTATTAIEPRAVQDMLMSEPAGSGDLWHARFYLLRPFMRASLIALWLVSGLVGLMSDPASFAPYIEPLGLAPAMIAPIGWAASLVDIAIALLLLTGVSARATMWLQLAMVAGYTLLLTFTVPQLWAGLFGPLLKNIPTLALIVADRVASEER